MRVIAREAHSEVERSMFRAREEIRELYDASPDEIINILISCDGTWQKRGFSSLFGAVFIIAYETGKVIDYAVLSKYCSGCKKWENRDKSQAEYLIWEAKHVCSINFSGSAGTMEPFGTLALFQRSLGYNLRYKYLISDGDSKTFSLLSNEKVYGADPDDQVEKLDCVGHVQKRLGTALRNLKVQYRGRKLSDGKTIGCARRLTSILCRTTMAPLSEVTKETSRKWSKQSRLHSCTATQQMRHQDIIFAHQEKTHGANGSVLRQ